MALGPQAFIGDGGRRSRPRLICSNFRAQPIAPCGSDKVSARTTSAPQLRTGGGISTDYAQRTPGQSNLRWVMSGGYIDERSRVKNFAVCQCNLPRLQIPCGGNSPCCRRWWLGRVVPILRPFLFGPGQWQVLPSVFLARSAMRKHNGAMRSVRGGRPPAQRLMTIIRSATLLKVAGSHAQCSSSSRTRSKSNLNMLERSQRSIQS